MLSEATAFIINSNWGTITFHEADTLIAFIDSVYRYMTIGSINSLLDDINHARAIYKINHGEHEHNGLLNMRERVYRQIKIAQATEAGISIPNTLIRNSFITNSSLNLLKSVLVERLGENGKFTYSKMAGASIVNEYSNILRKPYVWYILDSIGTYMNEYQRLSGDTENVTLETLKQEGGNTLIRSYLIKDTFDNFCKRANIQGEYRKQVKGALFSQQGTTNSLEKVKLLIALKGSKILTDMRFICVRDVQEKKVSGIGKVTVGKFCLELNADFFTYIEKEKSIHGIKVKNFSNGYQWRMLGMTDKILRGLNYIKIMSTTPELKATLGFKLNRLDMNFYIPLIHYLLDRWHTGSAERKSDMLVSWRELQSLGLLPDYSHRGLSKEKEKCKQDMIVVSMLCSILNEQVSTKNRRLLKHCENIEFDVIEYNLCFSFTPSSSKSTKNQYFPHYPRKMG